MHTHTHTLYTGVWTTTGPSKKIVADAKPLEGILPSVAQIRLLWALVHGQKFLFIFFIFLSSDLLVWVHAVVTTDIHRSKLLKSYVTICHQSYSNWCVCVWSHISEQMSRCNTVSEHVWWAYVWWAFVPHSAWQSLVRIVGHYSRLCVHHYYYYTMPGFSKRAKVLVCFLFIPARSSHNH